MAGWIYCERTFTECQVTSDVKILYRNSSLENNIPGIAGIDTRALAKILREKGTMNGMITTNENYNLEEVLPKIKGYTVSGVVKKVTCKEKSDT